MRVSINSSIASLVVDLSEEQLFSLLDKALNYVGKKSEIPQVPVLPPFQTGGVIKQSKVEDITKAVNEVLVPTSYKGFLYLQCEECKKFKGFMPKSPISKYHCDCGHTTNLKDMRVMRVDCKCGAKFKYLTNTTDNVIVIDCFNCGSPVDLEYHEKKQEYVTLS